jgi:hypothetical protein
MTYRVKKRGIADMIFVLFIEVGGCSVCSVTRSVLFFEISAAFTLMITGIVLFIWTEFEIGGAAFFFFDKVCIIKSPYNVFCGRRPRSLHADGTWTHFFELIYLQMCQCVSYNN